MVPAVGAFRAGYPVHVPHAASCNKALGDESVLAATDAPEIADVLALSDPESQLASSGYYEQTSLKVRAQTRVATADDGTVRALAHARLRFDYRFEAADGTKIRIRLKANLHYAQISGDDGQSQSIRIRAKASISVLQSQISEGVAPLLEDPGVSSEARDKAAEAIENFNQVSDALTALFLDSDPLNGDSLITGLVGAFNSLAESLGAAFLEPTAERDAVPAGDDVGLIEQVASNPADVIPVASNSSEVVAPATVESEPLPVEPLPASALSAGPGNEVAVDPSAGDRQEATSVTEGEVPAEANTRGEAGESQDVDLVGRDPSQTSARSAVLQLRLRVMQSLSSLVNVFDESSSHQQVTYSTFAVSARFAARYNVTSPSGSGLLPQGDGIDTQV